MDKEMQDLYNSMTPSEKQKYQREMQKQIRGKTQQASKALKDEVHKSGIVGTVLKGLGYIALELLTGGK